VPQVFADSAPVVELQVTLPPEAKIARDAAEHFLVTLTYGSRPVTFEVLGRQHSISVQFACRGPDVSTLREQLRAHFPDVAITEDPSNLERAWESADRSVTLVVDFGLAHEFMRPFRTVKTLDPDPLIAVAGALGDLGDDEVAALQILFQPCRSPWAAEIVRAVADPEGRSFFADAPEMLSLARTKVGRPLFAVLLRVAARSRSEERAWGIVRGLGGALAQFADPASNELIPLEPDGYESDEHAAAFLSRLTRRSGMLLNSEELVSLVHLPSASVRSEKLRRQVKKTKAAPASVAGHELRLGENVHAGRTTSVTLTPAQRTRHTYVIGASGTGKSTLLLNMIVQDLEAGAGIGVLDPHGDLVDRILGHVPDGRLDDVVLLDPADEAYPIGFNVLSAHSDLERTLIASDLVAVFRRLSTSWGDQMTSVLGNAILAFLESSEGGTLADLRRFLVEPEFRRAFLGTVGDREVVYYWQREFPVLAGKPQAPLLTRLDTFLRPKLIRRMVAQRKSTLDLGAVMNEGKIFLAKLSQGAIGEENAYLFGSLLVSKFQQLAMSRQELGESERRHFYLYIDEFHHFITPSLANILSGARKYRLGLILAHQDLRQLAKEPDVLSAVLTNPCTRIAFRVGDVDAKKLEEGFSAFRADDLQSLGVGEAIGRVERADWDFNLRTVALPEVNQALASSRRERIVAGSRARYGGPPADIERAEQGPRADAALTEVPDTTRKRGRRKPEEPTNVDDEAALTPLPGRGGLQHKYLQSLVKRLAEKRGFEAKIEKTVLGGHGHVDVALERAGRSVACEISVTTRVDHEVRNLSKCLAAGFDYAVLICADDRALAAARELLGEADQERLRFVLPDGLIDLLDELAGSEPAPNQEAQASKSTGGPSPETKKRLMIAKDAAAYIGLAPQTLAKMRVSGDSPPFYKVGRQVLYDRADLDAWLAERRRRSTSDPGQQDH
jgi:hypothetical protein